MNHRFYFKIRFNRLIVLLLIIACLSSCSTTGIWRSQETVTLTPMHNQKIAAYVVDLLLLNGHAVEETALFLEPGKHNGPFGQALRSKLQKAGYAIFSTHTGSHKVIYLLDELLPGTYRVDVRIEPDYQMELVYRSGENDGLVLHSVTIRNGSSQAVSCCNMPVENKGNVALADIAKRSVASVDSPGFSLEEPPENLSKDDQQKENTHPLVESTLPKSWSVQVISLSEGKVGVLEAISHRIEAMGHKNYIVEIDNVKKVRVGPFYSLEAARPVLDEMRTNGYPDAFLWNPDI